MNKNSIMIHIFFIFQMYNKFMKRQRRWKTQIFDQQTQNPETAFDKVYNIVPDTPPKEFKSLLECLSENMLFEKQVLDRTADVKIPKRLKTQIEKNKTYNNYETILNFSNTQKKKYEFQKSNLRVGSEKKRKVTTLKKFIETKKNDILLEENMLEIQKAKVKTLLSDHEDKSKIFEQALFLERLFDIEKGKMMNKDTELRIPEKFRGVNPKHMRILEKMPQEEDLYRRKHVYYQRNFQFYKHALKLERNFITTKKQGNKNVIKTILNHNRQILEEEQKSDENMNKLRKLFLVYASVETQNPENMYKEIKKFGIIQFFRDFHLEWQKNSELREFLKGVETITEFDFLEIIHMIANPQGKFLVDIDHFLKHKIWIHFEKKKPQPWKLMQAGRKKFARLLKITKFDKKVSQIFATKAKKYGQFDQSKIDFNEFLQIMWKYQFYPLKIHKKVLRFAYLYERSHQYGLDNENLANLFLIVGILCGVHKNDFDNMKQIIHSITGFKK